LWRAATERVGANPKYAGMTLTPQLGLVPLGPDPQSGLEEFGHPLTGSVPRRDEEGRLVLTEAMGLVFVLLPGGSFWMGAQRDDPEGQNYDPEARVGEDPVHEVELSPFLLSKYEMTQGQWEHLTGENPSGFGPWRYSARWSAGGRGWSALHPVEQVSWSRCLEITKRLNLLLPSEAQWEYGCRAGTSTVYGCGDDPKSLQGMANLADDHARRNLAEGWVFEPWLNDGQTAHAEIGSYGSNGFGLHDMHGNVHEWCLDGFDEDFYERSMGRDPCSDPSGSSRMVQRGSGFANSAVSARSAKRRSNAPGFAVPYLGLRPARALQVP